MTLRKRKLLQRGLPLVWRGVGLAGPGRRADSIVAVECLTVPGRFITLCCIKVLLAACVAVGAPLVFSWVVVKAHIAIL